MENLYSTCYYKFQQPPARSTSAVGEISGTFKPKQLKSRLDISIVIMNGSIKEVLNEVRAPGQIVSLAGCIFPALRLKLPIDTMILLAERPILGKPDQSFEIIVRLVGFERSYILQFFGQYLSGN
ncbi:hypothetical protein XELAEV_18034472mg [Xenopus laevis]|uniref:Uncharacterized protein n=1 Tax=Xenopus laevis TaxID=8355 RepID=A0A974CEZ9_XENLA|nr:hypothetical protein XELAEV_18034472mg [Xenopus laevis]